MHHQNKLSLSLSVLKYRQWIIIRIRRNKCNLGQNQSLWEIFFSCLILLLYVKEIFLNIVYTWCKWFSLSQEEWKMVNILCFHIRKIFQWFRARPLQKQGLFSSFLALAWSFHFGENGKQTHGHILISVPEMYPYSSSSVAVTCCDSAEALIQIYTILHHSN